jgi:hypothetical protein
MPQIGPTTGKLDRPRAGLLLAAAAGGVFSWSGTWAQNIDIGTPSCRGVRVVARNAQAADVLQALSTTFGFRVSMESKVSGTVNIDSELSSTELIPRVLPDENVITTQQRDPLCPGKYRLSRVWVLTRTQPPPAPHLPAIASIPVTPEAREQDELYQRAHGMLPPLDEPASSAPR